MFRSLFFTASGSSQEVHLGVHFEVLLGVHGHKIHVFGSLGRLLLVGKPPEGVASTFFTYFEVLFASSK